MRRGCWLNNLCQLSKNVGEDQLYRSSRNNKLTIFRLNKTIAGAVKSPAIYRIEYPEVFYAHFQVVVAAFPNFSQGISPL